MGEDKGKQAERPSQIPGSGLWQVGKRIVDQINNDHIEITAAGVAFYFLLSLFPIIVAFISTYGLVYDPIQVGEQMAKLTEILPAESHKLLSSRLKTVAQTSETTLGWGVALSILISLWSANRGTKALFEGINIAYNETEKRGFIHENALTLLFTLGALLFGVLVLTLVVGFPALEQRLGLPEIVNTIIDWGRWALLAFMILLSVTLIYKYAPVRTRPKTKWISWGAVIAVVLWMLGSWGFSFYVENFGNYNEGYGSAAAVVILILWLNLTSFLILLGAEINSELEFQTARDSTEGAEKPMGERGAFHADLVADQ